MPDATSERVLSAGVIVARGRGEAREYLVLRAWRNWDFPKGLVEPGEDALQAAIREVAEETSLTGLVFHWGHDFRETAPYGRYNKTARYYVAESPGGQVHLPISPELGHPEHEEFRWVGYAEACHLLPERVLSILAWAHALSQ